MLDEVIDIYSYRIPAYLPAASLVVLKGQSVPKLISRIRSKHIIGYFPSEELALITLQAWDKLELQAPLKVWVLDSRRYVVDTVMVNPFYAVAAQRGDNSLRWALVTRSTGRVDDAMRIKLKIRGYIGEVTLRDVELADDLVVLANDHERGILAGYPAQGLWFAISLKPYVPDYCYGVEKWGEFMYLTLQSELVRISLDALVDIVDALSQKIQSVRAAKKRREKAFYAVEAPRYAHRYLELTPLIQNGKWRESRRINIELSTAKSNIRMKSNNAIILDLWAGLSMQRGMLFIRTPYISAAYDMENDVFFPITTEVTPPFIMPMENGWLEIHKDRMYFSSTLQSAVEAVKFTMVAAQSGM